MKKRFMFRKCRTCPYALGQIRCIISLCRDCILSGRKTHPYTEYKYDQKNHERGMDI